MQLYLITHLYFYLFLIFCLILLAKDVTFMAKTYTRIFYTAYFDKDWPALLLTDQQNVKLSMKSFLSNMNSILDAHAPLKKLTKI